MKWNSRKHRCDQVICSLKARSGNTAHHALKIPIKRLASSFYRQLCCNSSNIVCTLHIRALHCIGLEQRLSIHVVLLARLVVFIKGQLLSVFILFYEYEFLSALITDLLTDLLTHPLTL